MEGLRLRLSGIYKNVQVSALGGAGVNIADMALAPSPDNSQGTVSLWIGGDEHAQLAQELIAKLGFPVIRA